MAKSWCSTITRMGTLHETRPWFVYIDPKSIPFKTGLFTESFNVLSIQVFQVCSTRVCMSVGRREGVEIKGKGHSNPQGGTLDFK